MDDHYFLYYLAGIPTLGALAQWIAWRLRLPSILLLLGFGIALGSVVTPDQMLTRLAESTEVEGLGPRLLFPLISLSVAVILFEGGLSLRVSELKEAGGVVLRLVTVGCLVSWLLISVVAWLLFDMDTRVAALLGAVLVVTGPTVVAPLLTHIKPSRRVGSIVKWEGIVIDPIGAVLAVLVFEFVFPFHGHQGSLGATLAVLVKIVLIGGALGAGTSLVLVQSVRRFLLPDFLHGVAFLTATMGIFAVSNWLQPESGLVTVTVLGVLLANQKSISVHHIIEFQEHLRVLLISCLFIVLGSRLHVSDIIELGGTGLLFLALLIVAVRPLSVLVATIGAEMNWRERTFVAFLAPRGIVAAAVTSVFALQVIALADDPAMRAQAGRLVPITFLVILGTVSVYGLMSRPLALWLKVADPDPQGIVFAGAEPWIREIAAALKARGIQVLLVDTNYSHVAAARMAGLEAECCSILSEHAQEALDLGGIGRLLALTANDEVNTLAVRQFAYLLGRRNVYQLSPDGAGAGRRQSVSEHLQGRRLFAEDLDHDELLRRFESGARIKTTAITEEFPFERFRETYGPEAAVLFVLEKPNKLRIRTVGESSEPLAGQTIVALVREPDEEEERPAETPRN